MKLSRLLTDILIYLFQIFLMITFSRYTQNNSLYLIFVFSFFYNLLLGFFLSCSKRYIFKILVLNYFFAITVYCFGNISLLNKKNLWDAASSICFNATIFFFFSGNWIIAIIINNFLRDKDVFILKKKKK